MKQNHRIKFIKYKFQDMAVAVSMECTTITSLKTREPKTSVSAIFLKFYTKLFLLTSSYTTTSKFLNHNSHSFSQIAIEVYRLVK